MQKIEPFTVVAFVLTQRELTLYSPEGKSKVIPQGDPRVARIVAEIQPYMSAQTTIEVDMAVDTNASVAVVSDGPVDNTNYFGKAEEQSNGVVRFFRVARSVVRKFFGKEQTHEEVQPQPAPLPEAQGVILAPASGGVIPVTADEKHAAAISEVMATAIPATSSSFKVPTGAEADQETGDTVVAVVGDTIIPNAEALEPQIRHAVKSNSPLGVQRLLERVASIAKKRGHSVEDLMKFMQIGDLPVNDNGDIVVFKALNIRSLSGYDPRFKWVDIHSKKVPQRLGSYVYMDESLVDPDRRQDCSNGLHIASRSYLSGFRGDVCVIALVRPEDVIAVPAYSHNKMRVCGYHIVAELTKEQYNKLLSNQAFTDDKEGQLLLGRIMEGKHIPVTNKVKITGHNGGGIQIEEIQKEQQAPQEPTLIPEDAPIPEKPSKTPKRLATSLDNPKVPKSPQRAAPAPVKAAPVDVKAIAKKATEVQKGGQAAQAAELYKAVIDAKTKAAEKTAAQALLDFKKKAKKGWSVLGLADSTGDDLKKLVE